MPIQFQDGSWGVRVQGLFRPTKKNPTALDKTVGDGRYGYGTRPHRDSTVEVKAFDGQPLHRARGRVRRAKAGCRLASRAECRAHDRLVERERDHQRRAGRPRFRARRGQHPAG